MINWCELSQESLWNRRSLLGFSVLLASLISISCLPSEQPQTLEERVLQIDRLLICPVCPGETIDQSQNELAKQMQAIVREKVAKDEPKEQILQFFVDRYGQGVLAEPPRSGFTLLVWLAPPIALAGAGTVLVLLLRRMTRKRPGTTRGTSGEEAELQPFLSQVDKEMASNTAFTSEPRHGSRTKKG